MDRNRKENLMRFAAHLISLALLFLTPLGNAAEEYPNRPIRLIVPYPAGGGTDIMARAMAEPLRKLLGQSIIVENKPGAGGALGAAEVARAPADGYTLLMTAGGFVIAPSVLPNAGYDPAKDFTGIAQVAIVPLLVVTRPQSSLTKFSDLLAAAREGGADVSYASFGNATPPHLVGTAIQQLGGVKMTHVPYKGGMQALPDIMAGRVTVGILDAVSMTSFVKDGRLKALAVTGPTRLPALPDVPTIVESGINFDAVGWHAVFAPAAVPPPIIERLNKAFASAAAQPDIRERIVSGGSIPIEPALSGMQWTDKYRREIGQWAEIVRSGRVVVE
jgi:tripartite-type tricarboxylate transporter receptor subunit TctC